MTLDAGSGSDHGFLLCLFAAGIAQDGFCAAMHFKCDATSAAFALSGIF
jgi:hypothetical protein